MKNLFLTSIAGLILASCGQSAQQQAANISKLENELKESGAKGIPDTVKMKALIDAYQSYVKSNPTDTACAMYLIKSGKYYAGTRQIDKSIACYHDVCTKFPNYSKADYALFSEAFLYETEKHDIAKAEPLYKEYLQKYPQGAMAKSAEFELSNLGKPIEQVMEELKNKQSSPADTTAPANP